MRKTLLNIGNSYLFTGIVVAIDKDFGYEVLDDEWSADDGTQPHAVTGVENEDYVIASSAQTVAYNPWGKVSGNEFTDYDCNGNVTRLLRGGLTNNLNGTFGLVDNLWMTYEGNRLVSVRDSAFHFTYANATDFDGVRGQEYPLTYDNAGALVSDAGRGIARTDYDLCGNPVRIQFTDGSVTRYIYSAAGEKLRVTYLTAVPNITVPIGGTRELSPSEILSADSTDYLLGGTLTMRNGRIDKYLFDEGYCQAVKVPFTPGQDSFTFYYYDRDHLGSVRQVIEAEGTDQGTVVQKMSYYPSGLQFCNSTTDSDVQPRRYNGKEYDKMHGLNTYDYGARQYNPVTARWDRMDPLCEKYYGVSPYAYCAGNPMNFIDPDGRKIVLVGSQEERMKMLSYLQKLTNDNLIVNKKTGEVTIEGKRWGNRHKKLNVGTSLLRDVISNKHTTRMQIGEEKDRNRYHPTYRKDASNGKGTDGYINLNPSQSVDAKVQDPKTEKTIEENMPMEMIVGHELIHANSAMNGNAKSEDYVSSYSYRDVDGEMYRVQESTDELETVGLKGNKKYTENKLRQEHGLYKRVVY